MARRLITEAVERADPRQGKRAALPSRLLRSPLRAGGRGHAGRRIHALFKAPGASDGGCFEAAGTSIPAPARRRNTAALGRCLGPCLVRPTPKACEPFGEPLRGTRDLQDLEPAPGSRTEGRSRTSASPPAPAINRISAALATPFPAPRARGRAGPIPQRRPRRLPRSGRPAAPRRQPDGRRRPARRSLGELSRGSRRWLLEPPSTPMPATPAPRPPGRRERRSGPAPAIRCRRGRSRARCRAG